MKKRVVARFTVDTDEDGKRWSMQDIALALDEMFDQDGKGAEAGVWDSLEDFIDDYDDGNDL